MLPIVPDARGPHIRGRWLSCLLLTLVLTACSDDTGPSVPGLRSYRMGFSAIPSRPDESLILPTLTLWTARADAALMHVDVPWGALLDGIPATTAVQQIHLPLADYYRAKRLTLVVTVDPTNGLNRAAEASELVARGRSIAEPAVQALYRDYVVAMARLLDPGWLGLVAETNLIRALAPSDVYQGLVAAAELASDALSEEGFAGRLYVSVQVETAWGLAPEGSGYQGAAKDLGDFPFVAGLGLSSYPYFSFDDPDQIPLDYYARLRAEAGLPVLVVEGGWTSAPVVGRPGTTARQARYLSRQGDLLEAAEALFLFQLTFTDLDLDAFPPPRGGGSLAPFAFLGLVDPDLVPKPALQVWDSLFALPRKP